VHVASRSLVDTDSLTNVWSESDDQLIGQLNVTPSLNLLGAQPDFGQLVRRVRLTRPCSENAVPSFKQSVTMKLEFERALVDSNLSADTDFGRTADTDFGTQIGRTDLGRTARAI
jgi:hypothetical protein